MSAVPRIPIIHSGGASETVAHALARVVDSVFDGALAPMPVPHHESLLQDWSDVRFAVISLNQLNVADAWINAATGAAYCSSAGADLTRICPVMFEMDGEDALFSRFQGLTVRASLGIVWAREELTHFTQSLAGHLGVEPRGELDINVIVTFLNEASAAQRMLAAAFPPLVPVEALSEIPPLSLQAIRDELKNRLTGDEAPIDGIIFVSWAKPASRLVGAVLHRHLRLAGGPRQRVYYSPTDIGRGEQWLDNFVDGLRHTRRAVFCISQESAASRWMAFEFGALFASQLRPRLLGIRVEDSQSPSLTSLLPQIFNSRMPWSKEDDKWEEDRGTTYSARQFMRLWQTMSLGEAKVWESESYIREMQTAHTGDVLKDLSMEAMDLKPYDIDLNDLASNVKHFDIPKISFAQAATFANVDLPGFVLDQFVLDVTNHADPEVHAFLGELPESHPLHEYKGYSLALMLLAYLAQRSDLSPESYQTIAQYAIIHHSPDSDIVQQILGFLIQVEELSPGLRKELELLWESGHVTWAAPQDLLKPWSEVIASVKPPLSETKSVSGLIDDLLAGRDAWIEQLIDRSTRSDVHEVAQGLVKDLLTLAQDDDAAARAASLLVSRFGTRWPASIPMLHLSAWASEPEVLQDVYARSGTGWRAIFALFCPWEEDLRLVCLRDTDPWVLRNVIRNKAVGHHFCDELRDHRDPRVAEAVLAQDYEQQVLPHIPADFESMVETPVDQLTLHGAALVQADGGRVDSTESWIRVHSNPDRWAAFVLASPIGRHITATLGFSPSVAKTLCAAPEVLSRITPVHLLSYLQNEEHLDGELADLVVPFPSVSAEADSELVAEQQRKANMVRLLDRGWALVPIPT